eukprot:gene30684-16276_t
MKNDRIAVIVVCGGGHIVSLRAVDASSRNVPDVNPLWTPSWPTADPALRKLACQSGMQPGELEGELLCGISGMNLCCDVFGEHSKGETAAGLCFHGEAGLSTWEVEAADKAAGVLVMSAYLRRTQLKITRTFTLA